MFTNDYIVLFLNNVKIKSNPKVKPTNPLVTEAAKESQGRHVLVGRMETEKRTPPPPPPPPPRLCQVQGEFNPQGQRRRDGIRKKLKSS